MSIDIASKIKELRARTGAGFLDCQKALKECDGDLDSSVTWLREKGIASFSKRSGNAIGSGDFGVYSGSGKFCLIALLTETDFVANTEEFKTLAHKLAHHFAENEIDREKNIFDNVPESLHSSIIQLKENIQVGDIICLDMAKGPISHYIHIGGSNRLAGVLQLKHECAAARDIAVHIACNVPTPVALEPEQVPEEDLEILMRSTEAEGGKISTTSATKRLSLLDAPCLIDPASTVRELLGGVQVEYWKRIQIGG